ncbi:aminotransferase class III-fold pyridoxal phosphate-dependent enzyme [Chitinophaga varians]|uniref:aminotransferase class III-fold pyridoxal phosphate-dependent enzyme n=1 Tax=Chitinophaga varians TaxID=2202339 RepID=UPI00165F9E56|nr:aminotransferase class III-fold pyridoxal phosphate-dependent enzyme [Chitinophaga varians]MBC9915640.1 aminotransferase class III-fold pyridoxal phosphate-dependent enzyme [Chitinophaga varians]
MIAIDNMLEKIVSKRMERTEALQLFEQLPENEKKYMLSKLKLHLSNGANAAGNNASEKRNSTLKAVTELQLTDEHKQFISTLAVELEKMAPVSKENASKHQTHFVDQRKTGGLKKSLKPLQFHLTYDRGEGAYLYDIDGNKYVDIASDNGVNLFGHQPEFVKDAIIKRLHKGYPLVGYTEELTQVTQLFSELTGHERVLLTQSGTEAVMWAVRIARAATQKKKIVIFDGAFHGLSDTVLAAKDQFGNSIAMGLGMLQEFADELIVLDYGNMDHLDIIEARADEIAGVLVEPVQSRHPSLQPVEFLREVRKLTLEKDILLIMDEMITGFRVGCNGIQGLWNIKGDLATYGKIPAGGMPSGMIAGLAKYMNFVDGGAFRYDDNTMPSVKKALMAGTHTRNPIKLAATLAVLTEFRNRCLAAGNDKCDSSSCFLQALNTATRHMCDELNTFFAMKNVPIVIEYFSSLFRIRFLDDPNGVVKELLLVLMRMNGVETSPSGNCFLTLAHSSEDIATIIQTMKKSVETLLQENFFYESDEQEEEEVTTTVEISAGVTMQCNTGHAPTKNDQMEKLRNLLVADLKRFQEKGGTL